jgi:thiosulfate/3-mercaptopyruvate sulfurtransferase
MRHTGGVVFMALALAACPAQDAPREGAQPGIGADPGFAGAATGALREQLLVNADWLAQRVTAPGVVVLHVGGDEDAFRAGHIPGARFIPITRINAERDGVPGMLAPDAELAALFAEAGVSGDAHVIVYGDPLPAARAFVALEYLGHPNVAMLNGGMSTWREAGHPLASTAEAAAGAPAGGTFGARAADHVLVDAERVRAHLGDDRVVLLDARPPAQFTGEEAGDGVPRPGHIPGAVNFFWADMIVSAELPVLRDPNELRARFRGIGADDADFIIAYCRTGMQSSFAYFVARYLGYDVRMYDGSFIEWSRLDGFPVER